MSTRIPLRIATDVGGTFTDLVGFGVDDDGSPSVVTAKSDTTPPDFEQGIFEVIGRSGLDPSEVTGHIHGTTVVINALTERKGVTVGLITTEGFRDALEIARGNRPDLFNLDYVKPPPFVPRRLRREVPGRLTYHGEERVPLDTSGVADIVADFRAEGVEAIAVSLIHSYANPAHELAVLGAVRAAWPEAPVVASHQITRQWREYERSSTAVLSAYVQPTAARYLDRLQTGLAGHGLDAETLVMQSNCGVSSLTTASEVPITMVESGPASGFKGAAELGRLIGEPNVIALDIGGTTAKCSLITDGRVRIVTDYWIERDHTNAGYPLMVPVVDLVEIGNGGGSIAWVDDFAKLHVGPRSAGADPGPASYGRGGTRATTTDANLWLGRIGPENFCGGEVEPDLAAAEAALGELADSLGLDTDAAARGIVRIANDNMVNALKLISVNRGFDPRDFTLVAFGGGGPMHAVALAQELGVRSVVVPQAASVFSAWGMIMSDLRRDLFRTLVTPLGVDTLADVTEAYTQATAEITGRFTGDGVTADEVGVERFAQLRYQNQEHTSEVAITTDDLTADGVAALIERFHTQYEAEYTYRLDAEVEFVGLHLVATADIGKPDIVEQPLGDRDPSPAVAGTRLVDYATDGRHEATLYDADRLRPGMAFTGPAVIEGAGTSVVVHPGCGVSIDGFGNTRIELPTDPTTAQEAGP
ncbi:MAG: hydantoinase/oxoprolinase family protein [Actinomycetota bacterium]